jgi:hypothetical protein
MWTGTVYGVLAWDRDRLSDGDVLIYFFIKALDWSVWEYVDCNSNERKNLRLMKQHLSLVRLLNLGRYWTSLPGTSHAQAKQSLGLKLI